MEDFVTSIMYFTLSILKVITLPKMIYDNMMAFCPLEKCTVSLQYDRFYICFRIKLWSESCTFTELVLISHLLKLKGSESILDLVQVSNYNYWHIFKYSLKCDTSPMILTAVATLNLLEYPFHKDLLKLKIVRRILCEGDEHRFRGQMVFRFPLCLVILVC